MLDYLKKDWSNFQRSSHVIREIPMKDTIMVGWNITIVNTLGGRLSNPKHPKALEVRGAYASHCLGGESVQLGHQSTD
jgi:hypothetical protein